MHKTRLPSCVLAVTSIAVMAAAYCSWLAIAYASQPPLDVHAFRQSQTALTAYWFSQEGLGLDYQTPVAGPPWAIPLEFPIYQAIVSLIASSFGIPLDTAGRLTSYAFLLSCLWPARAMARRLDLPETVFPFFAAILFSAPVYIYWGRGFMIETAALFFMLAGMRFFIDALHVVQPAKSLLLFAFFTALSMLQKATTAIPVLVVLSLVVLASQYVSGSSWRATLFGRKTWVFAASILAPLAIGFAWVIYSDHVKSANAVGLQLTSSVLADWNWGALSQRLSPELWGTVVWKRMIEGNLGGILGIFLVAMPFFVPAGAMVRRLAGIALALGFLPVLIFSNLHIVHDYYQTANLIFLICALALVLGTVVQQALGTGASVLLLLLVMGSNYVSLQGQYLPAMSAVFGKENRDMAIGTMLGRELAPGMQFVAFGNDWSSTFAYISQRKSLTVPGWLKDRDLVASQPQDFVEKDRLGAVVSCGSSPPGVAGMMSWMSEGRTWKLGEVHGCLFATPDRTPPVQSVTPVQCEGWIDKADLEVRDGMRLLVMAGWVTTVGTSGLTPERLVIAVTSADGQAGYLDTLRTPRVDVDRVFTLTGEQDVGFSRLMPFDLAPGDYDVAVGRVVEDRFESCQFRKKLVVPAA